jgi:hypothetical protein
MQKKRDKASFPIANTGKKARFRASEIVGIDPTPPALEEQGMLAFAN